MTRKSKLFVFSLSLLVFVAFAIPDGSAIGGAYKVKAPLHLNEGDILFQTMTGGQSEAIALATNSKWTHVGMVFLDGGEWMVHEAVGPVKATPLNAWIKQGEGGHYAVKRMKAHPDGISKSDIARMHHAAEQFMGIAYDWQFMWNDDKIYCSEFVWKVYKEGMGKELCTPKPMRDHMLNSELVQRTMQERYGSAPPLDELMIAPGALFECPELITVAER